MLQFIAGGNGRCSVENMIREVLDGGCRWIQIGASAFDGNENALREALGNVIPLCRENNAFMVIDNDVDLVEELKVHGVFLSDCSRETVIGARERLGAHAVIGVRAKSLAEIKALKGLDVDYVCVPPVVEFDASDPFAMVGAYRDMITSLRGDGMDIHVVATGDFNLHLLPALLEAGCAGVAVSDAIAMSENPAAETARILDVLDRARFGNGIDDIDADSVSL